MTDKEFKDFIENRTVELKNGRFTTRIRRKKTYTRTAIKALKHNYKNLKTE